MPNTILIDAGPLIALFDRDDVYHARVIDFIKDKSFKLITTLSVAIEVYYMLDFDISTQIMFYKWVLVKGLQVLPIGQMNEPSIIKLMEKYIDYQVNITNASLLAAAKKINIYKIISLDFDFYLNNSINTLKLKNIFPRS